MSLRCLIVDDEELARRLLRNYCDRLPQLTVVGEAHSSVAAMPLLREEPVDLLLLDVQMPGMTGLELLRSLRQPPAVILTTAYAEHALEGYDLDVVDYLLKPFPFERFARAVARAEERLLTGEASTSGPAPDHAAHLLVRADHKVYRVAYDELVYVEGMREYVAFHLQDGRRIVALDALKRLEETLPAAFLRIHKSYIVARNRVTALEGHQLRIGERLLPIGKSYREHVRQELFS